MKAEATAVFLFQLVKIFFTLRTGTSHQKLVLCAHAADPVGALQTHDVTVVGPHDPIEQFVRVLPRSLADGFQHGGVLGTHQLLHGRQCCGRVAQVKEGVSM